MRHLIKNQEDNRKRQILTKGRFEGLPWFLKANSTGITENVVAEYARFIYILKG